MAKIPVQVGGRMWREIAIIISRGAKRLISSGKLSKMWALHDELGIESDEGEKKISSNPLTPLSYGEFVSYLQAIKFRSPEVYTDTIRNLLQDDEICLKNY